MAEYLETALTQIETFEGCVPWMYLDRTGRVGVGVGVVLPDVAAAQRLPFQMGARAATEGEIAAEFARVAGLPMGRPAQFYRRAEAPELETSVICALLRTTLVGFDGELREKLAGYDGYPDGVKIALLDMAYNLGPAELLSRFLRLVQAVEAGAWAEAATGSFRPGSGRARNQWTTRMLLGEPAKQAKGDGALKQVGYGVLGIGAALVERMRRKP